MTVELVAVVLVLLAVSTLAALPPLHPAQLWAVPWAGAVVLFAIHLLPYRPISGATCWLIVLASTAFIAASVLGGRLIGYSGSMEPSPIDPLIMERAVFGMAVVTLVGLVVFAVVVASHFGARAVFVPTPALRRELTFGAVPLAIKYLYVGLAVCALAPIAANRVRDRGRRRLLRCLAAASIASMYFTTARANLTIALLTALTAHLLSRRKPPKLVELARASVAVLAVSIIAFVVLGNAIGKTFANSELASEHTVFTKHSALRSLGLPYGYLSGSIGALNQQLATSSTWGSAHGCADLSAVCRGLRAVGVDLHPVSAVRPPTAAPLAINIYTGLDLPLIDGGRALAVPIIAVQGLFFGLLWGRARRHRGFAMACYALASSAVLFSYSQNNFLAPQLWGAAAVIYVALWIGRRYSGRGITGPVEHARETVVATGDVIPVDHEL